jgi:hypothetical protein
MPTGLWKLVAPSIPKADEPNILTHSWSAPASAYVLSMSTANGWSATKKRRVKLQLPVAPYDTSDTPSLAYISWCV